MDRRRFLRLGVASASGAALLPSARVAAAQTASAGESPYGSIDGLAPNTDGVVVPDGFTARVVAVAGEPVARTEYRWRLFPDGAATFDDGNGGWYYVCNSEVFNFMAPASGGASAIHFSPQGEVLDAYPILEGSHSNCAGGPTPWGTWLSCEEAYVGDGLVWECDPTGVAPAVAHPAMGNFTHEAVAVDPIGQSLYLTEDQAAGVLYRYTPAAYPDLSEGLLEAATVAGDGAVSWTPVPDPSAQDLPTREQVEEATIFPGAEGIWYHDDWIYFTTKFDHRVHAINVRSQRYVLIWSPDPQAVEDGTAVLTGVDNITVDAGSGDLFVAEDGGNMEIVIITPDGQVAPFARVVGQDHSEITGPVFSPARDRLYFSSQRGPTPSAVGEIIDGLSTTDYIGGITYEITGPFRGIATEEADTEPEPEVESEPESEPVAEPEVESDAAAEPEVEPEVEFDASAEPEVEPEPVAEPVVEPEPGVEPEPVAEPEPAPVLDSTEPQASTPSPVETLAAASSDTRWRRQGINHGDRRRCRGRRSRRCGRGGGRAEAAPGLAEL